MRKAALLVALVVSAVLVPGQVSAAKRSGVNGVVLDTTCYGPCVQGQASPAYTGTVTVQARRVTSGQIVASQTVSDGQFRIKLRRGIYDVSAISPGTTCTPSSTCTCPPNAPCICPQDVCAAQQQPAVVPCTTGDTRRVKVRRHRFTHVKLHVQNICVV